MIDIANTIGVCIDIQGNLAQTMDQKERLFKNVQVFLSGLSALDVPIIVTEQNPFALGRTIPAVAGVFSDFAPISKMSFSCCGEPRFMTALKEAGKKQVILVGIEAHICVYQTARDLVDQGYSVEVVVDGISSRTAENKMIAVEKMKAYGIGLTSAETVLFDLLKTAESPKFKEVVKIVK